VNVREETIRTKTDKTENTALRKSRTGHKTGHQEELSSEKGASRGCEADCAPIIRAIWSPEAAKSTGAEIRRASSGGK
jgi:hypothetical protein